MTPFYGAAILCLDDDNLRSLLPRVHRRFVTYGFRDGADISADEISIRESGSSYRLRIRGGWPGW